MKFKKSQAVILFVIFGLLVAYAHFPTQCFRIVDLFDRPEKDVLVTVCAATIPPSCDSAYTNESGIACPVLPSLSETRLHAFLSKDGFIPRDFDFEPEQTIRQELLKPKVNPNKTDKIIVVVRDENGRALSNVSIEFAITRDYYNEQKLVCDHETTTNDAGITDFPVPKRFRKAENRIGMYVGYRIKDPRFASGWRFYSFREDIFSGWKLRLGS